MLIVGDLVDGGGALGTTVYSKSQAKIRTLETRSEHWILTGKSSRFLSAFQTGSPVTSDIPALGAKKDYSTTCFGGDRASCDDSRWSHQAATAAKHHGDIKIFYEASINLFRRFR